MTMNFVRDGTEMHKGRDTTQKSAVLGPGELKNLKPAVPAPVGSTRDPGNGLLSQISNGRL
jgi:hypothetical protein